MSTPSFEEKFRAEIEENIRAAIKEDGITVDRCGFFDEAAAAYLIGYERRTLQTKIKQRLIEINYTYVGNKRRYTVQDIVEFFVKRRS